MADNIPENVTDVTTDLNNILSSFILRNSKAISYRKLENDDVIITIRYGKYRDPDMKKIKEFINNTIYDTEINIDGIPATCIKVSDSVMVFKGTMNEIEAYSLGGGYNNSDICKDLSNKLEITDENFSHRILNCVKYCTIQLLEYIINNKSNLTEAFLKEIGATINTYKDYGNLILNYDKLCNYFIKRVKEISDKYADLPNDHPTNFEQFEMDLYENLKTMNYYKITYNKTFNKVIKSDDFIYGCNAKIVLFNSNKLVFEYDTEVYKEIFVNKPQDFNLRILTEEEKLDFIDAYNNNNLTQYADLIFVVGKGLTFERLIPEYNADGVLTNFDECFMNYDFRYIGTFDENVTYYTYNFDPFAR